MNSLSLLGASTIVLQGLMQHYITDGSEGSKWRAALIPTMVAAVAVTPRFLRFAARRAKNRAQEKN